MQGPCSTAAGVRLRHCGMHCGIAASTLHSPDADPLPLVPQGDRNVRPGPIYNIWQERSSSSLRLLLANITPSRWLL